jgi:predicted transposase YdaD
MRAVIKSVIIGFAEVIPLDDSETANPGRAGEQGASRTSNPHDKRQKALFSNKKSFLSLLRDCVKAPWVEDIDEDSLTQTNSSFILQDFSEKEADVVYEAQINGSTVVFYVLLELQSSVDYTMPYRLLLYIVEILRHYYNSADAKKRENKDFKFPVVFPLVFFSGKETWTVPLNFRDMCADADRFGDYALNFEYALVNAKGYDNETLKNFSSKLLGITLMLEKARNDVEFFSSIRDNLDDIEGFDAEEKRILSLCIKLLDMAYGYNKGDDIKELLEENKIREVDRMLCDIIEYAKHEKEEIAAQAATQAAAQARLENSLEVARKMMAKKYPINAIIELTNLSKKQIEEIEVYA